MSSIKHGPRAVPKLTVITGTACDRQTVGSKLQHQLMFKAQEYEYRIRALPALNMTCPALVASAKIINLDAGECNQWQDPQLIIFGSDEN